MEQTCSHQISICIHGGKDLQHFNGMQDIGLICALSDGSAMGFHRKVHRFLYSSIVFTDNGTLVPDLFLFSPDLPIQLRGIFAETCKHDCHTVIRSNLEPVRDRLQSDLSCFCQRITIDAGGNSRESNGMDIICFCKLQTVPVAVAQELCIPFGSRISGANRVNDVRCLEFITFGDLCLTSFAAMQSSALCKKFRTGSAMNCTIHTASTQKTVVGCVDNTRDIQSGNIHRIEENMIFPLRRKIPCEDHLDLFLGNVERQIPGIEHHSLDLRVHKNLLQELINVLGNGGSSFPLHQLFMAGKSGKGEALVIEPECPDLKMEIICRLHNVSNLDGGSIDHVDGLLVQLDRDNETISLSNSKADRLQNSNSSFANLIFGCIAECQNGILDCLHRRSLFPTVEVDDIFVHYSSSFKRVSNRIRTSSKSCGSLLIHSSLRSSETP